MPYEIRSINGEFCVVKQGMQQKLGCHPTQEKARRQMAALYANEPGKATRELKATVIDDDSFRLLAIPFGGPIPSPANLRGVDLDGEFFTERTDIKANWFSERPVDWHHGKDQVMGRTVIGKAINLVMEEDGWWVDVWLKHGERRLDLIKRLAEQAMQTGKAIIFGSSESAPGLVKKASNGEILSWAFIRETLSTSPQNTLSVLRPLKATLEDLTSEGIAPSAAFWSDIEQAVVSLSSSLRGPSRSDLDAKAGRVLAARNESDLLAAVAAFDEAVAKVRAVLARQPHPQEGFLHD